MGISNLYLRNIKTPLTLEVREESWFDHILGVLFCGLTGKHIYAIIKMEEKRWDVCLICGRIFD